MKKIGILTLHSSLNEGALLQALAISLHLKKHIPSSIVEIIDFRYSQKIRAYGPLNDQRKTALFNFTSHAIPLSGNRIINNHHHNLYSMIDKKYDMLILGSDEIWKLQYTKNWFGKYIKQQSPWHPAFPNAYWPEKISTPIAAYAPSIGRTDLGTIPQHHRQEMARRLGNISLLSYRDEKTRSFFNWLNPELTAKSYFVPDPVFTIPLEQIKDLKASVKNRLVDKGINFKRPRLGVILDPSNEINNALRYFRKRDYQIIGMSYRNEMTDIDLSAEGFNPLEWICALHLMDACLSNRFHGCISCLLGGIPFIGFDQYDSKGGPSKIEYLLKSFGLDQYYYNEYNHQGKILTSMCETLTENWGTNNQINTMINTFKRISINYTNEINKMIKSSTEYETV